MEKVVRKFRTFEDAERADREYYASLTPDERMAILLELVQREHGDASKGLERVYRVVELGER